MIYNVVLVSVFNKVNQRMIKIIFVLNPSTPIIFPRTFLDTGTNDSVSHAVFDVYTPMEVVLLSSWLLSELFSLRKLCFEQQFLLIISSVW